MPTEDETSRPSMPRITVIIPTYNWSSVLPYSIGSVLRQTFSEWELLVIGDACTDDSEAVVERMRRDHPEQRIRWINLPVNAGNQFGPNNEGLRQAQGEVVAYLGHDDLWLPHHLACLLAAVDSGADVAHSVVKWVFPNGHSPAFFLPQHCVSPSSVMHRRGKIAGLGGWRDYREIEATPDTDLWERAREGGCRFRFVPRLTVIKFPASARRDVYKVRPCHEQAAWFERIGRESDLEAVELTEMLCAAANALHRPPTSIYVEIGNLLFKEAPKRLGKKLQRSLAGGKGAQVEAWRVFKGLERKP
jgi:glycosyltransferase involved in cell wall biosynthesis